MCVCVCRCTSWPEEGGRYPRVRVSSHELPEVGAGNPSLAFCERNKCSWLKPSSLSPSHSNFDWHLFSLLTYYAEHIFINPSAIIWLPLRSVWPNLLPVFSPGCFMSCCWVLSSLCTLSANPPPHVQFTDILPLLLHWSTLFWCNSIYLFLFCCSSFGL